MDNLKNKNIQNEFEDFMKAEEAQVPEPVSKKLQLKIGQLLHPKGQHVFLKLLGIHIVVGFLSLSICHQFGVNPFHTDRSLSDWFMDMGGHSACMFGCGLLFVGLSYLIAGYFLTIEEVRVIKRTEISQTLALGVISLALFWLVGAELVITFVSLWMLGGLLGGYLANQTVLLLKKA